MAPLDKAKEQIGIKEFVAILLYMIATKSADDTSLILFKYLDNAAWMAPIISGVLVILPIVLLVKVLSFYKDRNLLEVTYHLFGKFIGFIIMLFLWLMGFCYIVVDTAVYTDIIGTMYYPRTPSIIIYGLLMMIAAYGAKRGLEQVGSTAWIFLPYLQVTLSSAIILTLFQGNSHFLFPIFGPGIGEIIKESFFTSSIYLDIIYVFLLFPYVKSTKDFKKGLYIGYLLIITNLTLFFLSFIILFDFTTVKLVNYPYHEVLRTIHIGFLTNLETLLLPFWLIAVFIKFAIYLYINIVLFGWLFKIDQFEYIIPIFATLIVFLGLISDNLTLTMHQLKEFFAHLTSPLLFGFPIVLWLMKQVREGGKD